jgi:hypothetical protein
MTTRHIKVSWKHSDIEEPVELYSELDDVRWEIRKVEVFRNGALGYACHSVSRGGTFLGLTPIPSLAEIARDPQFEPVEIVRNEFEDIWLRATRNP